jgi:uncharacterized protein (TIGR00730 family)
MQSTQNLHQNQDQNQVMADAYRLAFNDPEFLLRPETRGIRFQLELLKPELIQAENGIAHTAVIFGSARFKSLDQAQQHLEEVTSAKPDLNQAEVIRQAQQALQNAHDYEAARELAKLVSLGCLPYTPPERLTICTGGGPGIMEAANRGAHEAGALSVALNISLPHEQAPNAYVTPALSFQFHYFALRKMHFAMRAKVLIAFPGGFGTLDELFEVLTLVQTRKVNPTPVLLYGSDYWKKLINFEWMLESGTISKQDLECFKFVDSPEEAWQEIKKLLPC